MRFAGAAGVAAVIAAALVLFGGRASTPQVTRTWSFVEAETDPAALGFQLSTRETGEWLLEAHEGATGNRALANRAGEPTALAAHAVVGDSMARDLKAWTRCKVSPERAQRACGLVLRHLDPNNYYVASVDAGRHIVTLSVVVAGVERELRSAPADLSSSGWQVVAVTADADYLEVSVNGGRPLSVHDATFPGPGRVGLWAPAEGEAYFDELSFSSHAPTRLHPSDLLPIFVRRKT